MRCILHTFTIGVRACGVRHAPASPSSSSGCRKVPGSRGGSRDRCRAIAASRIESNSLSMNSWNSGRRSKPSCGMMIRSAVMMMRTYLHMGVQHAVRPGVRDLSDLTGGNVRLQSGYSTLLLLIPFTRRLPVHSHLIMVSVICDGLPWSQPKIDHADVTA